MDADEFWEDLPAVVFQDEVPALDNTVIAVGYPLGATSITVTRGVVSNVQTKDLTLRGWDDEQELLAVQIDAAINPGNSGGPVFNQQNNKVVGKDAGDDASHSSAATAVTQLLMDPSSTFVFLVHGGTVLYVAFEHLQRIADESNTSSSRSGSPSAGGTRI